MQLFAQLTPRRFEKNTYPRVRSRPQRTGRTVLNGPKDEYLGVCVSCFLPKAHVKGQDGGMATALLLSGSRITCLMPQLSLNVWLVTGQRQWLQRLRMRYDCSGYQKYSRVKMQSKIGD